MNGETCEPSTFSSVVEWLLLAWELVGQALSLRQKVPLEYIEILLLFLRFLLYWNCCFLIRPYDRSMDKEQFAVELKQSVCLADWHRRYFEARSRKYHRIDYWMRASLGLIALAGAAMAGKPELRLVGAIVSASCAFIVSNALPIFKWDSIVSGFKSEEKEWTRLFQRYEDIQSVLGIADPEEILFQEFQKTKESQKAIALNDAMLPIDQRLLNRLEKEVRKYHGLDKK